MRFNGSDITHFVYPYVKSEWGEELRYSLRSLDMFFTEPFDVTIIGELPDWVQGVEHIEWEDNKDKTAEENHGPKLHKACDSFKSFVWMNDDIYLLKSCTTDMIDRPRAIEDLNRVSILHKYGVSSGKSRWQTLLWNTVDKLESMGLPIWNAETHTPYFYSSSKLKDTLDIFDVWEGKHLAHTAYFNMYFEKPYIMFERVGIYSKNGEWPIEKHSLFLNHDDSAIDNIKQVLPIMFSEESRFEA